MWHGMMRGVAVKIVLCLVVAPLLLALGESGDAVKWSPPQSNCSRISGSDNRYRDACAAVNVLHAKYYHPLSPLLYDTKDFWRGGEALQATLDFMAYTNDRTFVKVVQDIHLARPPVVLEVLADGSWDDSCWWILAYIQAHEVLGSTSPGHDYIGDARRVFDHVWEKAYSNNTCGGGVWWSSINKYKNAITNELVIACAARLYLAEQGAKYLDIATSMWSWFKSSGMMDAQGLINDGLNIDSANKSICRNNGQTTWTYNQGVILGAAAVLFNATKKQNYIDYAVKLTNAVLSSSLTDASGILTESCGQTCNENGKQFKGIFVRNLRYLVDTSALTPGDRDRFCSFLATNTASMLAHDKTTGGLFGGLWQGPVASVGDKKFTNSTDATTQTSALDLLLARCA